MIKNEVEYTFEIYEKNIESVLKHILSNKSVKYSNKTLVLEKGKIREQLIFLSSNGYNVTQFNEGTRHRLKVIPKKKKLKFVYDEKIFKNNQRLQKKENLESDYLKAFEKIKQMPPVDAVQYKKSLRYEFKNHIEGSSIILQIDNCVSVNPENPFDFSDNYYYMEVEEDRGIKISEFFSSSLFTDKFKKYLNEKTYRHFNKIRRCTEYFNGKVFKPLNENQLSDFIEKVFSNSPDVDFDKFINKNELYIKGSKAVEGGSNIETEYKFLYNGDKIDLFKRIQEVVPNECSLSKTPHRIISDIYFDTKCKDLYANKYSFRYRKRKKENGWISCFKCLMNDSKESNINTLDRVKIRSSLNNKDAMGFLKNEILGDAFENLVSNLKLDKSTQILYPQFLIVQIRDRLVVRCKQYPECEILENSRLKDIESYHYDLKRSEIVHIIHDHCIVYNLSGENIEYLIHFNELNENNLIPVGTFNSYEIEFNKRDDVFNVANKVFSDIVDKIEPIVSPMKKDKYQLCFEL